MFIFVIFFPLLDMLGYSLQYGCAWYYNHMMVEELAVRTQLEGTSGTVKTEVDNKFRAMGLPRFLRITALNGTPPTYDLSQNPPLVICTTVVKGEPFIPMPMFGFTQTSFTMTSDAIRENNL